VLRPLPVVALTGPTTVADIRGARDAGFDGHVPKPVDSGRLAALLTRILVLPRAAPGESTIGEAEVGDGATVCDLHGAKILIVEDHDDSREMLARLVASHGATALVASDGEEGLRVARAECPDLVLCDLRMPRMDGYDFIRQVRGDERLFGGWVIAISAFGEEIDRTWRVGFSGHLAKPIQPAAIQELLGQLFGRRPQ
jgi:CheY-like chemotaxis protein